MNASQIVNSLVAGELSPKLKGRTDIVQYYQSGEEIKNCIVEVYGGAKKDPGTYFVNEVKDSSADITILRKFVFSEDQAYQIEIGNLYMRFYKDNAAIVEASKDITNITTVSSKALVECVSHGYSNLDTVVVSSVAGMIEVNNKRFLVADATADEYYLQDTDGNYIDPTDYTAYISDGLASKIYEIATSYSTSVLRQMQFAQKEDILYITIGGKEIAQSKLSRFGDASWTLEEIDYAVETARPAMMKSNITDTTIAASAGTGSIVLTASDAIFDEDHVGSIWSFGPVTGTLGYAQIVSVSSGGLKTVATASVLYSGTLPTTAASTDWAEGSWSKYRGFPKAVTISEQRLEYGYTDSEPQTGWASVIGAYETFEVGAEDSDAMTFRADTNRSERMEWLFPAHEILIGTAGGVTAYGTGSDNIALTPTTGRIKKKSSYGVQPNIMPQMIGNSVFYWQKYGRILREYVYTLDQDKYVAKMATKISDHITESGIVEMDYQQSPNNMLWCIRTDGKMASLTVDSNEGVLAWTSHDTQGFYESVSVIPKGSQSSYDEVWYIVKREIDGVDRKYIEYMVNPEFEDQEDQFFVHCGLGIDNPKTITNIITATSPATIQVISASHGFSNLDEVKIRNVKGMTELNRRKFLISDAATDSFKLKSLEGEYIDGTEYTEYISGGEIRATFETITDLEHLEGKLVQVCADGGAHPSQYVIDAEISLNDTYSQAAVGLGYTARIKTNDLEAAPGKTNSKGRLKRVSEVTVDLYRTLGGRIGTDEQMDPIKFRTSAMNTDEAPPLHSGVKRVAFPSGWDREKHVIIEQDQPLNMHVRSIISELEVN